jgi:pimeloyl-ACP methyl ester carboxylesterase
VTETDVDSLVIGVIEGEVATGLGLARAAARSPGLSVRVLTVDEPYSDAVAGLIVDASLGQRAQLLARVAGRWPVPILIESPVAGDVEHACSVQHLAEDEAIVAANPLHYALHTRRLLEELAGANDPLQTFLAAWRFRAPSTAEHALPQLLDYVGALCMDQPGRLSAMQRRLGPAIVTVTLRYASDVLGSIEVGGHLPESFPSESELVVECFCHASAYSCVPGNQAVQLYGGGHAAHEWQPEPADAIVARFAGWLRGGARPPGGIANDLTTLRLVDRVSQAIKTGRVLELQAV